MAKKPIKHLVSPWSNIDVTRNGVTLSLVPLDNPRGEGKYPGLTTTEVDFANLEVWTDKGKQQPPVALTEEETKDADKVKKYMDELTTFKLWRNTCFTQRVFDLFNGEIRSLWREVLEKDYPASKQDKLTDADKTTIITNFEELLRKYFAGERAEREKDSAFYAKRIAECNLKLKPLLAKAKGKLANLTLEEQAEFNTLKESREGFTKLRDEKLAEENASAELLLEDLE